VERRQLHTVRYSLLSDPRLLKRFIARYQHKTVERGIELFYVPQVELDQLNWRQLPLADQCGLLRRRGERQLVAIAGQLLTLRTANCSIRT
jgi:hypothetical protein